MRRSAYRFAALGLALALCGGTALAQTAAAPKATAKVNTQNSTLNDAFKGFGSNTQDPMQIEADNLDVFDNDNYAIFTGNVVAKQRETVLKTARLKVFYEPRQSDAAKADAAKTGADVAKTPAAPAAAPKPQASGSIGSNQTVRRLEAEGKVLLTQNDQSVSGETGWFDMPTNKAQVNTNVVLVQGTGECKNIATGIRLDINLVTGEYTLRSGSGGNTSDATPVAPGKRVVMILQPTDKGPDGKPKCS